jgi:hypothetical protein
MNFIRVLVGLSLTILLGAVLVPRSAATEWDKKTEVEFKRPIEIPGMVLAPGKYVIRLMDSQSDRHIVQFYNANESHLYATVLTIPDERLQPPEKVIITFEERASAAPEAIKAWFYPGDPIGEEFVYPRPRAMQLAETTKQNVLAMPPTMEKHVAESAKPAGASSIAEMKKLPVTAVTPEKKEIQLAQAMKPKAPESHSVTSPASAPVQTLPKTASDLPVICLIGGALIALGIGLNRLPLSKA